MGARWPGETRARHLPAAPPHLPAALGPPPAPQSYERLEFLGDAVLGLACRTVLMQRCPGSDEVRPGHRCPAGLVALAPCACAALLRAEAALQCSPAWLCC